MLRDVGKLASHWGLLDPEAPNGANQSPRDLPRLLAPHPYQPEMTDVFAQVQGAPAEVAHFPSFSLQGVADGDQVSSKRLDLWAAFHLWLPTTGQVVIQVLRKALSGNEKFISHIYVPCISILIKQNARRL